MPTKFSFPRSSVISEITHMTSLLRLVIMLALLVCSGALSAQAPAGETTLRKRELPLVPARSAQFTTSKAG
jgi:hypothetical protein